MTTLTPGRRTQGAPKAAPVAPDSPEAAGRARACGAQLREHAAAIRADAAADVQAARAALAEAEARQRRLGSSASNLDVLAVAYDTLGNSIDQGRAIGARATEAETALGALTLERDTIAQKAADLEARLGRLAEQREGLDAVLAQAVDGGDVAAVTQLRPQLDALDEVAAQTRRQLAPLQARLYELGDTDIEGRQLYDAANTANARRASYSDFLDDIGTKYRDPTLEHHLALYLRDSRDAPEQTRYTEVMAVIRDHPGFATMAAAVQARHPDLDGA